MNIMQASIAMDISEHGFEIACGKIRVLPNEATIYCAHAAVGAAYQIKKKYDCAIVLIPDELAKTIFCWAVIGKDSMFWSPGIE